MGRAEAIVKCDAAKVSDRMLGGCEVWNGEEESGVWNGEEGEECWEMFAWQE
jgi:hypothetical protein